MKEEPSPEVIWQHLLLSGGYSIGYFSVTVEHDEVRVYHSRTQKVTYFSINESFKGMERLCNERGYDLAYLLGNYYPKSYHAVNMEFAQRE